MAFLEERLNCELAEVRGFCCTLSAASTWWISRISSFTGSVAVAGWEISNNISHVDVWRLPLDLSGENLINVFVYLHREAAIKPLKCRVINMSKKVDSAAAVGIL